MDGNTKQSFWDEAAAKEPTPLGKFAVTVLALCGLALVVMLTIKLGMVLFG
jgi:hypothetical protein